LYRTQGKYEEAEQLYKRCLEIRETKIGKNHPDVATSLNNLAELYRSQGKYEEAEPLYQRSLGIYEKALGKDHLYVAQSLGNLALLYKSRGNKQYEGYSLNKMGKVFKNLGLYDKATDCYEQALEICESIGDERAEEVILGNLANVYMELGKYDKAEKFYIRTLAIAEKIGYTNIFAQNLYNIGSLYLFHLNQPKKAKDYYTQAMVLFKKFNSPYADSAQSFLEALESNTTVIMDQSGQLYSTNKGLKKIG